MLPRLSPTLTQRKQMQDYRQIQKEILDKRRSKTQEYVRRVMKRMDRPVRPISVAHTRATDPSHQLPTLQTEE